MVLHDGVCLLEHVSLHIMYVVLIIIPLEDTSGESNENDDNSMHTSMHKVMKMICQMGPNDLSKIDMNLFFG
jgi:hypothetical protein